MTNSMPYPRLVALTLLLATCCQSAPAQDVIVKGTVTSKSDGSAIPGVTVTAYVDDAPVGKATTARNGTYSIDKIPSGKSLTVTFRHSAWNPVDAPNLPVQSQTVNRVMEPRDELKVVGRIKAVGGNKIRITTEDGKDIEFRVPADTKVEINGREAKVEDLKQDDKVILTVAKDKDDKTVKKIEVKD